MSERKEGAMERQRRLYRKAGLVQINAWVPSEKKQEILEDCARLRWEHLRHVGYRPKGAERCDD